MTKIKLPDININLSNKNLYIEVKKDNSQFLRENIVLNEFLASSDKCCGEEIFGKNKDYVELYNKLNYDIDISGWGFSDKEGEIKTVAPDSTIIRAKEHFILWYTGDDNFPEIDAKLKSGGETIYVEDKNGNVIINYNFGEQEDDIAFGRYPDGEDNWIKLTPNPGSANYPYIDPPQYNRASGFYSEEFNLEISHPESDVEIFYTLDGSMPNKSSTIYSSSILINNNTVINSKAYKDGYPDSKNSVRTFIFNDEQINLPTFFLTVNPEDFFDDSVGMYVMGDNAETNFPHFNANFWQDIEKPIHFEILETDGSGYNSGAGVQIFGGWSRGFPFKSLAFYSRSEYGNKKFKYKLFPDSESDNYNNFVLRNSGNDFERTMLRDGFITTSLDGLDFDKQDYRPTITYINGQFWGLYNLREKVNEHFIEMHHDVDADEIDLLEKNAEVIEGSNDSYTLFLEELRNASDSDKWDIIDSNIDVDNHIYYNLAQIFYDNRDWPGNNVKFWKSQEDGKWRWIIYDTDFGASTWDPNAYKYNTLEFALEDNGPVWPNPPWSTELLRLCIKNNQYIKLFLEKFMYMLNNNFKSDRLNSLLDELDSNILPVIDRHINNWKEPNNNYSLFYPYTYDGWNRDTYMTMMRNFIDNRQDYILKHFKNYFNYFNYFINLNSYPNDGADSVSINGINFKLPNIYYSEIMNDSEIFTDLTLKIIPKDGYTFDGWFNTEDSTTIVGDSLIINTYSNLNYIAKFSDIANNLIINGSFENDIDNWVIDGNSYSIENLDNNPKIYNSEEYFYPLHGKKSLKMWGLFSGSNTNNRLEQSLELDNRNYRLIGRFFTHYDDSILQDENKITFGINGIDSTVITLENNKWQLIEIPFTVNTTGSNTIFVNLFQPNYDNGAIYIDNITLRHD